VQSYVDGCCKTCESHKTFFPASQATLRAVNQMGERLVAWQWMGLLAEWFWGCGLSYRVEPVTGGSQVTIQYIQYIAGLLALHC